MATFVEGDYKGVSLKLDGVFISPDKINPTPSELDSLDSESETQLRIAGCEAIQDAGKLLKLPQVAVACAQVLYHRFYFSKSFVRHNWEHYAMACVFLSAKIEESCRRLRDVVNVFVHLRQLREQKILKPLPIAEYAEIKQHIIKAERRVLKELGFCVHGKHPHKLICIYLHILKQSSNLQLVQLSWNYMNDSFRTIAFVCYQPEEIACACIYLAALHLQWPLGTQWYEIFNVSESTIQAICLSILALYSLPKPNITALENKISQLRKAQIEARNARITLEKKETTSSHAEKSKRVDKEDTSKRENDNRGKENRESSSSRKKSHKPRKSSSPRYKSPKHRSRSPKRERDYSRDHRKNHRKYSDKDREEKRPRRSYDSGEEYSSDKRKKNQNVHNGSKDYYKYRSPTPASSESDKRYRKRRRSSSPSNEKGSRAYIKSVSKHSSRKLQNDISPS